MMIQRWRQQISSWHRAAAAIRSDAHTSGSDGTADRPIAVPVKRLIVPRSFPKESWRFGILPDRSVGGAGVEPVTSSMEQKALDVAGRL